MSDQSAEREWRVWVQDSYHDAIGTLDQRVYDTDAKALRAVQDAIGRGRDPARVVKLVTMPRDPNAGDGAVLVYETNRDALLGRACVVIEPASGCVAKGRALYALLEAELPACIQAGCLKSFATDVTTHDRRTLGKLEWQTGVLVWIVYDCGSHLTRDPDLLRSFVQDHPEARYYAIDCDHVRIARLDPPAVASDWRECVKLALRVAERGRESTPGPEHDS